MIDIQFTPIQRKIIEGLEMFGEDVVGFFQSGVEIYHSKLSVKSHLLAHCAREIDGGLRDTLSPDDLKKERQKTLKGVSGNTGHIASILTAIDEDYNSEFAKQWIEVATQFAGIAHRNSDTKKPRVDEEGKVIWDSYELVLLKLVGNFFDVKARLKRIINFDRPTDDILKRLPIFLKNEALSSSFWWELASSNWLQPLYTEGFFQPITIPDEKPVENMPDHVIIPRWIPIKYLIKVAKQNLAHEKQAITDCLKLIISDIINFESGGEKINNRSVRFDILDLILLLPASEIKNLHFIYIESCFLHSNWTYAFIVKDGIQSLIDRKEKTTVIRLIKLLVQPRPKTDSTYPEVFAFSQEFSIAHVIEENTTTLSNLGGIELIQDLIEILKVEIRERPHQFITLDFDNIFDSRSSHDSKRKPRNFLSKLVAQLLLHTSEDISSIVIELWKTQISKTENNSDLKRLGFWLLNQRYETLKELFWTESISLKNAEGWVIHEFAQFLKNHKHSFTDIEIDYCIKMIDSYRKTKGKYAEHYQFYACRLLYLIEDLGNPKITKLLKRITKSEYVAEIKINDYDFRPSKFSITRGDIPPESAMNFSEKNIFEIIDYLKNFNETDRWGKIAISGVTTALRSDLINSTQKYFDNWVITAQIPPQYLHSFFYEVDSIARKNQFSEWENLLKIIESILPSFSVNDSSIQPINWIFNSYCSLPITREDNNLMPKWKILLTTIAPRVAPRHLMKNTDFWTSAFNSAYGTTWIALLQWQGRNYQILEAKKSAKPELDKSIILAFETEFDKEPSEELYAVLGHYAYHLKFWSKDWFYHKLSALLSHPEDTRWVAFMETFLGNGNHHFMNDYFSFFQFLRDEGHLEKAANHPKIGKNKTFVYFLLRDFELRFGKESYEKYAIDLLFQENQDPSVFGDIIFFFWQKDENNKSIPSKDDIIRYLWLKMLNVAKVNIEKVEFQKILPALLRWTDNLTTIDSNAFEWITFSLQYIHLGYEIEYFLESIILHIPAQAKEVGKLILIFSNNTKVHLYKTESLESVFEELVKYGEKEILHDILNNFGKNGQMDLDNLYVKYFS